MFSTKSPPSVQRIPWPSVQRDEDDTHIGYRNKESLYDTWLLNEDTFPWLVDSNGRVWPIFEPLSMSLTILQSWWIG